VVQEEADFGPCQYEHQVSECCFLSSFLFSVNLASFSYVLPLIVMVVTFASHTLWFGKSLDGACTLHFREVTLT
jgi:hypothetical protein